MMWFELWLSIQLWISLTFLPPKNPQSCRPKLNATKLDFSGEMAIKNRNDKSSEI